MPNTLVKTQPFFKIPPCLQQRILFKFNQTLLDWNFMDYIIPDLSMAYNISFDESVMKQNLKKEAQQLTIVFGPNLSPSIGNFFFGLCTWELEPLVWQGTEVIEPSRTCLCDLSFDSCLAPRDASTFGFWISFVLQLVQLKIVRFQICLTMLNSLLFLVVIMENIPIWTGSIWSAYTCWNWSAECQGLCVAEFCLHL